MNNKFLSSLFQMMEALWSERRENKVVEDQFDREQMRYNPINWSMTLK